MDNIDEFETWYIVSTFIRSSSRSFAQKLQPKVEKYITSLKSFEDNPKLAANHESSVLLNDTLFYSILQKEITSDPELVNVCFSTLLVLAHKVLANIVKLLSEHNNYDICRLANFYASYAEEHHLPNPHVNAFYFCCFLFPLITVKVTLKRSYSYFLFVYILREIFAGTIFDLLSDCSNDDKKLINDLLLMVDKFKESLKSNKATDPSLGDQIISLCRINDKAFSNVTKLFTQHLQTVWEFLVRDPVQNQSSLAKFVPFASIGIRSLNK